MPTKSCEGVLRDENLTRRRLFQVLIGLTGVARSLHAEAAFTITNINHIYLNVGDLKKSEAFYTKLFGPPATKSSSDVFFQTGSTNIAMGVNPGRHAGVGHVCLSVEGYEMVEAGTKLKALGIAAEPNRASTQLYFRDPDGILIQLERPSYSTPGARRASPSEQALQPLFKVISLDHITLQVSNLEKSTAFYAGLFGPVERGTKNNASLRMETGQGLTWTTSGPGSNPIGIDHFCIAIDGYEPDAVTEKLKQAGIASQRLNEPDQVYFRDPDGILVQLAQDSRARRQSSRRK